MSLFISYASDDQTVALEVCALLEAQGIRCWIAPRDVAAGAKWDEAIVDAITDSQAFLLLLTGAANASPYVSNEVNHAFGAQKPIFTFRIEDVTPSKSIGFYLARHHWSDGFPAPIEEKVAQLAAAVTAHLGAVAPVGSVVATHSSVSVAAHPTNRATLQNRANLANPPNRWLRALPWALAAAATIAAIVAGTIALRRPASTAPPMWMSIPAPVDQFGPGMGPAISPDGQRLAFSARDASGKIHLWVRALDAQSARMIAETQGGTAPFWSPDGDWVGFFKDGKLQKINIAGGSPQILADALNQRGAAWSPADVILYVPVSAGALYRIPASGGVATPLDFPADPAVSVPVYPSFLPDGEHFLYTSLHEHEDWISVGSLDGKTTSRLMKVASRAEYANGYLVFGSTGVLYAQPFDVADLALSGERVRVADSVGFSGGNHNNYSFSSTKDVIAVGNMPYVPLSQLTWFDGNGQQLGTLGDTARILHFSVAPDRTRAAIEKSNPKINSFDPWIIELSSGFATPLRVGAEGAGATAPLWSPDGQQILYVDNDGLRIASSSGGAETRWPLGRHWPQSSSPDGQFLLIVIQTVATGSDLMLVPLSGDHIPVPYLQTSFNESHGRFSPDGRTVAYMSNESGQSEVYVQSFPKAGNKIRISTKGGSHPEWSDDGNALYFLSADPDGKTAMMVAEIHAGGSVPRRLFDVPPGPRDSTRSVYAIFDQGRRFLILAFAPDKAPQNITVGVNWSAAMKKSK